MFLIFGMKYILDIWIVTGSFPSGVTDLVQNFQLLYQVQNE